MRSKYGIQTLVVWAGLAVVIVLVAAFAVWHEMTAGASQSHAKFTGTIQFGPDGDTCQRFVIDNRTGFISQDQSIICRETAKDSKHGIAKDSKRAPERHEPSRYSSGGRIDAIRDSFNNR